MRALQTSADTNPLAVLEFRQYTLRRGMREPFVRLFDSKLAQPQIAVGAVVLGLFHDLDDPDRVVWLRAFRDMSTRQRSLEAFYGGPVWAAHRGDANETIVDSDNALLLEPFGDYAARAEQPLWDAAIVRAEIIYLASADPLRFGQVFEEIVRPRIELAGAVVSAAFISLSEPNNFPRLPLRENERVLVWFSRFDDAAAECRFTERLNAQSGWRDDIGDEFLPAFARKPEIIRLQPLVTYPAS
ncbi:MAG: hypothetical protein JWM87_3348 [Candidatus Eremiobacteraeota bacterium]|nr:hypothetical protein [Candidatus Eremiobacteraeota bacterium]